MAKTYQYCVAENWGKGFIEHQDSREFSISGFPGNVWRVPAHNPKANIWISKVLGSPKTKDEAQVIVSDVITTAQTTWDNNNVAGETAEQKIKRLGRRPVDITLLF